MRQRELRQVVKQVSDLVQQDIADHAKQGHVAAGLANEGFNAGYLAALDDVLLTMTGVTPNRFWWRLGSSKGKSE